MNPIPTQTIVFGGGCFWCTEAVFASLVGVSSVLPGYAGGTTAHPSYQDVLTEQTGHAEVVQVTYEPEKISVQNLLTVFFATHDPTQVNRQGNDVGTQYRSVIFYTTDKQQEEAEKFISDMKAEGIAVVTVLEPLAVFYPADESHQDYFTKNPQQAYCQLVINPKLEKLQKEYGKLLTKTD